MLLQTSANASDKMSTVPNRAVILGRAVALQYVALAWMTIEAGVALSSGIRAQSTTLVAFGADSLIELLSAMVLLLRLRAELRDGANFSISVEERSAKIAGALLFALAVYVFLAAKTDYERSRCCMIGGPVLSMRGATV
jgi:hypothetical protein